MLLSPWCAEDVLGRYDGTAEQEQILHVMTASLHHAKPFLSAAINSGFRESGVQSLKNLNDPDSCPMVAVRTAGLGLEAIIASISSIEDDGPPHFQPLVAKDYVTILLRLANERFGANMQRIERFRTFLRKSLALETEKVRDDNQWESPEARRERKRDQGLKIKSAIKVDRPTHLDPGTFMFSSDDQVYLQLHPSE